MLLLVGSLPLTFRRVAPLTVLGVAVGASIAYQALGHHPEPLPVAVLVALYAVAVFRRPLVCSIAAAVYVAVFTVAALTGWVPLTDDQYYIDLVSVVATVMLGYGVALSRARATVAEQKAAALARDSETAHAGSGRAGTGADRARGARHRGPRRERDRRAGGRCTARLSRPAGEALDSLTSIEAVGRDALDGLRRLMGLLRSRPDDEDRSPQPSLARLPLLLAQVERAGLDVELTVTGTPGPLPATVELNAYRIVQEALTNSLKHAGPTRATVTLEYGAESLQVEVRDQGGTVDDAPSTGYGLVGMQQRATMLGGDLVAGPAVDRGFRVSARLPLAGAAHVTTSVLIADDQPLMRSALRTCLDGEADLTVVAEAVDGAEAVRQASDCGRTWSSWTCGCRSWTGSRPPGGSSPWTASRPARVLVMTTFDLDEHIIDALRAGASGFLVKDSPAEDLVEAVRLIAGGQALLAPSVTRRLLDLRGRTLPPIPSASSDAALAMLTARELRC